MLSIFDCERGRRYIKTGNQSKRELKEFKKIKLEMEDGKIRTAWNGKRGWNGC